ncbi:hypothetical protein M758_UG148700 [Ceratodon purpureus]|nr:hypothetical protein M758_UG148700 [Ceratodon purpureus]
MIAKNPLPPLPLCLLEVIPKFTRSCHPPTVVLMVMEVRIQKVLMKWVMNPLCPSILSVTIQRSTTRLLRRPPAKTVHTIRSPLGKRRAIPGPKVEQTRLLSVTTLSCL